MRKHLCPCCSSEVTCETCLGVGASTEWHYYNQPGTESSILVGRHCLACQSSGRRTDHLCVRVTDWLVSASQTARLQELLEDMTFFLPGQRSLAILSSPVLSVDRLASVRIEARPRDRLGDVSAAASNAATDWAGIGVPVLHSLVTGYFHFESDLRGTFEVEIDLNWRAQLDGWVEDAAVALSRGGRAYLVRVLLGTA